MFGSNFPQLTWKKCLERLQALGLAPEVAAQFLSGNAKRVFHFG